MRILLPAIVQVAILPSIQRTSTDLSEMDARTLAAKYDFSGGQIENIARHYTIDSILHDTNKDMLAMLINHCDNEKLDGNTSNHIGFC